MCVCVCVYVCACDVCWPVARTSSRNANLP